MEPTKPPRADISAAIAEYFGLSAIAGDAADLAKVEQAGVIIAPTADKNAQ